MHGLHHPTQSRPSVLAYCHGTCTGLGCPRASFSVKSKSNQRDRVTRGIQDLLKWGGRVGDSVKIDKLTSSTVNVVELV